MKIGILECGHISEPLLREHGNYPSMFQRLLAGHGFQFETYCIVEDHFPKTPDECEGWIITGSVHGVYEDHSWIAPLEELIRQIYAADVPMVGVCFGHQIMAQAMGGKVIKFNGIWGAGAREYTLPDGSTTTLLAMHQDQVVEVPPEAKVDGTADYCSNALLTYKGNAMSIQPHPEFTPEFIRDLLHMRRGKTIPVEQAEPALATLENELDSHSFGERIANFFIESNKQCREAAA